MKIADPGAATLRAAIGGDLAAIDAVLLAIQPGVFNLAIRILGHREDAADATQEILLKTITHLGGFRGESAFPTWVYRIARNHLLTAHTRAREAPDVSFESIAERLDAGLAFGAAAGERVLTPEDKAEAREIALGCTQGMLMALDRDQRLVYVLDAIFELPSKDAAAIAGTTPEAWRQRVVRVRARMADFAGGMCGLTNTEAPCRCERQVPAIRHVRASGGAARPSLAVHRAERDEAERQFGALVRIGEAAAMFRAHPEYRAPAILRDAIVAVLRGEGYWDDPPAARA